MITGQFGIGVFYAAIFLGLCAETAMAWWMQFADWI
jgi:hypothetical protein